MCHAQQTTRLKFCWPFQIGRHHRRAYRNEICSKKHLRRVAGVFTIAELDPTSPIFVKSRGSSAGCLVALGLWSAIDFVPSKHVALICLGLSPFAIYAMPARFAPNTESTPQGLVYGFLCMSLMLLTGVAGPLLDSYFLGGRMDRRAIIATKGACQVFGHGLKLIYFGRVSGDLSVLDPVFIAMALASTIIGTSIAKRFLEAMTETQFRTWARSLITGISLYYVAYGSYLWASIV